MTPSLGIRSGLFALPSFDAPFFCDFTKASGSAGSWVKFANVDGQAVKKMGLNEKDEKVVELSNGCMRCGLKGDLLKEIMIIAKSDKYDVPPPAAIALASTSVNCGWRRTLVRPSGPPPPRAERGEGDCSPMHVCNQP